MARFRIAIGSVVTFVWAAGCGLAFTIRPEAVGLATAITPMVTIIVGFLFAGPLLEARKAPPNEPAPQAPPDR